MEKPVKIALAVIVVVLILVIVYTVVFWSTIAPKFMKMTATSNGVTVTSTAGPSIGSLAATAAPAAPTTPVNTSVSTPTVVTNTPTTTVKPTVAAQLLTVQSPSLTGISSAQIAALPPDKAAQVAAVTTAANTAIVSNLAASGYSYPILPVGKPDVCPYGYSLYKGSCIKGTACELLKPYNRLTYAWAAGDKVGDYSAAGKRCATANPQGCERVANFWYPKCKTNYVGVLNVCTPSKLCANVSVTPTCKTGTVLSGGSCFYPCNTGFTLANGICSETK